MWNAAQYLKFEDERTQPCFDLTNRIAVKQPERIIDLGCGPGNSSRVLRDRWPEAEITGLDNSDSMIEKARQSYPEGHWVVSDIAEWTASGADRFDILFSNAALHWVPDHEKLFPLLLKRTNAVLAVQMPANWTGRNHQMMRELASSSAWSTWFPQLPPRHVQSVDFYYDLLTSLTSRLDIWQTEYIHVMNDAEAIVEWYKGTGLRPYLDALQSEADRERFLSEYLSEIRKAYPPQANGKILFPFQRLFLAAYP